MQISCACDAKAILGEGPYWDVTDQRLYWVDIKGCKIHRFDPATGHDETWSTPEVVGSLAVRAKGGLVVALRSGLYFFDLTTGQTTPAVLPPGHPEHNRFNDGKVDRQGRFWAGSMDDLEKEPSGGLFRLDPNLDCQQLVDRITISNSLCWSPDSRKPAACLRSSPELRGYRKCGFRDEDGVAAKERKEKTKTHAKAQR
jgi:L-arabinonolactonase